MKSVRYKSGEQIQFDNPRIDEQILWFNKQCVDLRTIQVSTKQLLGTVIQMFKEPPRVYDTKTRKPDTLI